MNRFGQLFLPLVGLMIFATCSPVLSEGTVQQTKTANVDGIITESREHCQETIQLLDQMSKILKGAKKSNDAASMRLALDGLEKPLADMKEHLNMVINKLSTHETADRQKRLKK